MNLRSIDLNLLPIFEAIYAERNLTRASEALNISQPAVSNALTRLRAHFGDPLFVRAGRGVAPTSAADGLIPSVREALTRLRSGFEQMTHFDAATSTRVFNIAARDAGAFIIAPAMLKLLEREAPRVRIHWRQFERAEIAPQLASRRLDFAVDVPGLAGRDIQSMPLMMDHYVCAMRRGHPMARKKLTLESFLDLRHIAVSSRHSGRGIVDGALRQLGLRVSPVSRLPHFLPAFQIVMSTDCVMAAPRSLALAYDVAIQPLPFESPPLHQHLYWRNEAGEDPALRWLRDQIASTAVRAINQGG